MSVGRGFSAVALSSAVSQHTQDATSLPRFGRGRARFSSHRADDDTAMALLRRQLLEFDRESSPAPLTPVTPTTATARAEQFSDARSDAGTTTPPRSPTSTSGTVTPKRRPRYASEASSSISSTPRSGQSSFEPPGELADPNCVCFREKKQVICRMCGNAYRGRVRRKCVVHQNTKMLMDNDLCSTCGIPCLFEYDQDVVYDRE